MWRLNKNYKQFNCKWKIYERSCAADKEEDEKKARKIGLKVL